MNDLIPDVAILPNSSNETPPITGVGIVLINAASLPENPSNIESAPAPMIIFELYTLVSAITPMFSPYVVVGTEPNNPDKAVDNRLI